MLSDFEENKLLEILFEDAGEGDATGMLVPEKKAIAEIVAEEDCVVVGVEEAKFLLETRGGLKVKILVKDGQKVKAHTAVMECKGSNRAIFLVERTALNIMARMSAVASECSKAAEIVSQASGGKTRVAVTRKTMPGFNIFDKKAARIGGAQTHRRNLSDMVLLKTNELAYFENASAAVKEARRVHGFSKKVEVEAETLKTAIAVCETDADIVMLDNMKLENARKAVREIRKKNPKILIELSGGINFGNLHEFASIGANIISMGSLTQAVKSKSFGMEIRK